MFLAQTVVLLVELTVKCYCQ